MIMLNIIRSHLDRNLLGLRTCPITDLRKEPWTEMGIILGNIAGLVVALMFYL